MVCPVGSDTCVKDLLFAPVAKHVLGCFEKSLQQQFNGIDSAASALAKQHPMARKKVNKVTKIAHMLAASMALERHFTEFGISGWLQTFQDLMDSLPSSGHRLAPTPTLLDPVFLRDPWAQYLEGHCRASAPVPYPVAAWCDYGQHWVCDAHSGWWSMVEAASVVESAEQLQADEAEDFANVQPDVAIAAVSGSMPSGLPHGPCVEEWTAGGENGMSTLEEFLATDMPAASEHAFALLNDKIDSISSILQNTAICLPRDIFLERLTNIEQFMRISSPMSGLADIVREAEETMVREITEALLDSIGIPNDDPMFDSYWEDLMKAGKGVEKKSWLSCRSAMCPLAQRIREYEEQCLEEYEADYDHEDESDE